jgi:predicted site-specific integrase-resolvase
MYLPSRKASKYLGVHPNTLRHWADTNKIKFIRNPAGQRLYDVASLEPEPQSKLQYCYCRVSSYKQKDDLQRQISFLKEKYPNHTIVSDIGSGLNFKRKGLLSILEQASLGNIQEVVVAHRDRLARFGFDLIRWLLEKNGGRILVLDNLTLSPEKELVTDIISILTVFSCRIHGLRKYSDKIKKDPILSDQITEEKVI